jgi:hypothetical protein
MSRLVISSLEESRELTDEERAKVRGGLVRIFENHVLQTLNDGGVEEAGRIQEERRKNDIFSW